MAWCASVVAAGRHASRPGASGGRPDDAVGISMELPNPGQEPGVLLGPRTRHPRRPAVIPAGRHP